MVEMKARIGMAIDQRLARVQIAPAQHVTGKSWRTAARKNPVEAGSLGSRPDSSAA